MATNSADYCILFIEWALSKLIRLEVDIDSVLESEFGLKWRYGPLCIKETNPLQGESSVF